MFKLAFFGEVKLNFLLLSGIGSNIVLVTINVLGEHKRKRAVRDLTEKVHGFTLGRNIGHDDLALVWLVNDDVLGLVRIFVVVEKLVSVDHHNVFFYFALAFFNLFLE